MSFLTWAKFLIVGGKVLDWVWLVRAVLGEYMLVGYVGRIYLISVLFVNICFPNRPKCPFCG